MDKRIVYARPDGGLSVIIPAPKARLQLWDEDLKAHVPESDEVFQARIAAKDVPPDAIGVTPCDVAEIPADRSYRDAWCLPDAGDDDCAEETTAVAVRMSKAREIQMGSIRWARDARLAALDVTQQRALVAKNDAEVQRIETVKQELRDIPQSFDLAAAKTPAELRVLWPEVLAEAAPAMAPAQPVKRA
jgi:Phage tail assembly chaperone protein